jgi:hypothetical protein
LFCDCREEAVLLLLLLLLLLSCSGEAEEDTSSLAEVYHVTQATLSALLH